MMMYRQYTITGMNKKKNSLLFMLWILIATGSRILYFILSGQRFDDTYEYFAHAMVRAESSEPALESALSYAFTHHLSGLLRFTGNLISMAGFYQMVIQILWITLFLLGISFLFGKTVGFAASGVLMLSPFVLKSMFLITPENYFMLYFSIFLTMLGYYCCRIRNGEWMNHVWNRCYLGVAGFLLGVLCIWNYLGAALFVLLVYVQVDNYMVIKNNFRGKADLMGAGAQACSLLVGLALGICAPIMKYTGLTGLSFAQQFAWWLSRLGDFSGRCQEVSNLLLIWLLAAVLAGGFSQWVYRKISEPEMEEEMQMEETKDNYVVTEKHGKVKLLDNPLPVPKKHVRKGIGFDIDEGKLEFDYEIGENDDFDI